MKYIPDDKTAIKRMLIDISDILEHKLKGLKEVNVYYSNLKIFKDILGDKFFDKTLDLTKITPEDISILEEYLDYIKLIEEK